MKRACSVSGIGGHISISFFDTFGAFYDSRACLRTALAMNTVIGGACLLWVSSPFVHSTQ